MFGHSLSYIRRSFSAVFVSLYMPYAADMQTQKSMFERGPSPTVHAQEGIRIFSGG